MTTINDLSDAILCEIFLHIDVVERQRLELVCKKWQKNIRHIWSTRQKLMFRLEMVDFCPDTVEAETTPDWIRFTTSSKSDVLAILKICEGNLTHLEIEDDGEVPEKPVEIFVPIRKNKNLISFSLTANDEEFMRSCMKYLPTENLEELAIYGLDGSFVSRRATETIEEALKRATTLKSLKLSLDLPFTILDVIERITTLQSLELGHMESSPEGNRLFFNTSTLGNLESLTIRSGALVDDHFLTELAKNCKKLRSIKFQTHESLTDNGLIALGTLTNLRCVDIMNANSVEVLAYFSNLEEFYCDLRDQEETISEEDLSDFLERSPDLKICHFGSESLNYSCHEIATKVKKTILFKPHY